MGQRSAKVTLIMGISKPDDSEALLQKSIDTARDSCKWMSTELVAARKAAADCTESSRKALRERKPTEALEQKQAVAALRVSNLEAELDHSKTELAELETRLATTIKERICKAGAFEVDKRAATFAARGADAVAAIVAWRESMEPLLGMPDMVGTHAYFANVEIALPETIKSMVTLAGHYSNEVLSGRKTLPGAPVIPQPVIAPPTTQVFSVREICWTDANGDLQLSHRWRDVSLPPETARKALAAGVVVPMQHELRRQHLNVHNFTSTGFIRTKPAREACLDLDGPLPPDAKAVAALVKPSASVNLARSINPAPATRSDPRVVEPTKFEVVDRGPPIQMSVARNDLEGIAHRKKGEDQK
jgi:hypothetical protein